MSKEKDNVIQFPNINQDEEIQYDEIMADNPYFRLTFINALHVMGLPCNTESVKTIQKQMEVEETGIVGITILLYCSNVFDPPIRQEILNNIEKYIKPENIIAKKEFENKSNYFKALLICIIFITFFIWGVVDCWSLIADKIRF